MGSATSLIRESPGTLPVHLNSLAPILDLHTQNDAEQLGLDGTHTNNNNNNSSGGGGLVRLVDSHNHAAVIIGDHEGGETTAIVQQQQQQQPGRLWLPAPITLSSMTKRPKVRIIDPHARSPFLPSSPKLHLHRYSPLASLPRRVTREGANIVEMSARNNTTNQWDPRPATPATASFGDECALQQDAFGEEGEDVQV